MHILDIIQNSIKAKAELIQLLIDEDIKNDKLLIKIIDDGCGMSEELQKRVLDPFVTSRTTRKVGLGLSLFQQAAKQCEGDLKIESTLGEGTVITVDFKYSHIDRAPLGDLVGTIITILSVNPDLDLLYRHLINDNEFIFDTRIIKEELEDVQINLPEILSWLESYLTEGLEDLRR
ncbi:ATP-binding protein [Orenia metallireducens]|uniref:ATP-binding protein n=1 Tax=Orenia metallireducens TaxID=1413210 RepID=UPI001FDF3295|nr:ATP-binding protein [Orenia metallireducens]